MWLSLDWNAGDCSRGLKNVREPRVHQTEDGVPIRSEVRIVNGIFCGGYGFIARRTATIKDCVKPVSDNPIGAYPKPIRKPGKRRRQFRKMARGL
jgi:hypothetical protein